MERPRTQADVRKERFNAVAESARSIGDSALREIDKVLVMEDELLAVLHQAHLPEEEINERITAYRSGFNAPDAQTSPNFFQ